MERDRFGLIPRKGFSLDATHVLMKRDRVSRFHSVSVKRLWHRIGQALACAGTNLRNKLGHGGGLQGTTVDKERPERVRHLAIEIGELLNKLGPKSLGDALDALDTVNVTAIEATHGRERADEFDLLVARFSKEAIAMLKNP